MTRRPVVPAPSVRPLALSGGLRRGGGLLAALGASVALSGPVLARSVRPLPAVAQAASPELAAPVEIDLHELPAAEVVALLFDQILHVSYVTTPAVNADRRSVSVRIKSTMGEARAAVESYLGGLGYRFVMRQGVDQVSVLPPPTLPPPPKPVRPAMRYFVYQPAWRDASDLGRTLAPLFPEGRFSAGGSQASAPIAANSVPSMIENTAATQGNNQGGAALSSGLSSLPATSTASDSLVFYGTAADTVRLQQVLPQVDTPQAEVMVRASVFEVDTQASDGSAFNLALSLLRTKLTVGLGSSAGVSPLSAVGAAATGGASTALTGNFVTLQAGGLDAVIQSLASDQRFKLVTAPTARVRSGQSAELIVGQQVPVLGSVAYTGAGAATPVQSVEYKNSGVILTARPYVRRNTIDLDLKEEISSFVQTTSGVNSTPTLQQRTVTSALSVQDGAIVCIGGLTQTNNGKQYEGFSFLPAFFGSHQRSSVRTDVLLILQVTRLNQVDGQPTPDELVGRRSLPAVPQPVDALGARP